MKSRAVKGPLPLLGVGPVYVAALLLATAAARLLRRPDWLRAPVADRLRPLFLALALLCVALGALLYGFALFGARISRGVREERLVTEGVYAWVRHPIYSAALFICSGVLLLGCDYWLLVGPPLFWLFLTLLMRGTEEKWLRRRYGRAYEEYCRRVPRCLPRFPRRRAR